jgi:RHS repeat-associated protein
MSRHAPPDGDLAIDAAGNAYLAWTDNGDSWDFDNNDLRMATVAANAPAPTVTKHYYANGQRIATRVDGTLYYLLDDRLGSTTVVADDQGNEVGRVLYDPYGEVLESTLPAGITDRLFTGQRWDDTIGLYDYNARFYDPQIGQFTQPDSLVSDPLNPATWNRFSYTAGNPVNNTDSSGHFVDTLLDALDLANNVQNCLGDSDTLSCYMVPVSVAFVAVPFLSGGGMEGQAARATRGAEDAQVARIYETLEGTEYGSRAIRRADIGTAGLPETQFKEMHAFGLYSDETNVVRLDPRFRDLPPELAAPTLAHELSHRSRRWRSGSLLDEARARKVQAGVWAELRGRVSIGDIPAGSFQMDVVRANEETLQAVTQGNRALLEYLLEDEYYASKPFFAKDVSEAYKQLFEDLGWTWSR